MTLWQDRAYTTIQATNSLPTMADDDRWSPRRPSDLAAEQAKAPISQVPSSKIDAHPIVESTIEGGFIIEWSHGNRESSFSIRPNGCITVLQCESNSNYKEADLNLRDLEKLFSWLAEG